MRSKIVCDVKICKEFGIWDEANHLFDVSGDYSSSDGAWESFLPFWWKRMGAKHGYGLALYIEGVLGDFMM